MAVEEYGYIKIEGFAKRNKAGLGGRRCLNGLFVLSCCIGVMPGKDTGLFGTPA